MSLTHAKTYKKYGFSVIATDEHKRALSSWKQYQSAIPTDEELKAMFSSARAKGLAVICGAVSGNLEVIDVDCKYDTTGTLFEDYMQLIADASPNLAERLLVAKTINGGYHIYYRSEKIEGNQKFARREATKEEKEDNPHETVKVLIESRGEAGYVLAAPTPGYKFLSGKKPSDCPTLTADERDIIIELARSMNQWHEKPVSVNVQESKNCSLSPFDDYNNRGDFVGLLQKHGWVTVKDTGEKIVFKRPGSTQSKTSGDYNKRLGWFSVFTTSSIFEPNKAYRPYAVYAMLECGGDYSKAAKQLLDEGFGRVRKKLDRKIEQAIRVKRNDGLADDKIASDIKELMGGSQEAAEDAVKEFALNAGDSILTFWDIELTPKGGRKIHIVRTRLLQFLTDKGGFHLYFYDRSSKIFKIIQDNNGLIEEASTEQIKKFIKNYIQSLPGAFDDISRDDLLEAVYKGSSIYFSEGYFEFLEPANIDFLKDTADVAYFPFNNGVVCVSRGHIELKTYGELKKSIWKSQVIDFNIDLYDDISLTDVEFFQFISKICNDDPIRIKYCCALIGYILHKYKDPTKPYMIVFGEETEDEKKGGGTGKGIMVTAISKLINVEQIDGKNFKVDKNFAFQRVKLDTHFVVVQDVRKNFDLEGYYSVTTEGMTIEKKNKDELYIPYSDSPKIGLTTNYTVSTTSNHAKRRVRNIEFGNFFHPGMTPADHFKHRLFEDWDKDQWNLFYNFMFHCVRDYMINSIPELESSETLKKKQIRLSFGEEYWNWWDEYSNNGCADWKLQGDLYTTFLGESDFEKKDYLLKRFKRALEDSCNLFGYEMEHRKNRQASNKIEVRLLKKGEKSEQILHKGETNPTQNDHLPF